MPPVSSKRSPSSVSSPAASSNRSTLNSDAYEIAEFLRALCLASSTITRLTKTQFLIASSGLGMDDEISEAIRQVNAELRSHKPPTAFGGDEVAYQESNSSTPAPIPPITADEV